MKQPKDPELIKRILALRGEKSYTMIAQQLGVSRNVVAGICFRTDWPKETRINSPRGRSPNKCGLGRHGRGAYAKRTLRKGINPMTSPRAWTDEADEQLCKMIMIGTHVIVIAEVMGRTPEAVRQRASRLGLSFKKIRMRRRA